MAAMPHAEMFHDTRGLIGTVTNQVSRTVFSALGYQLYFDLKKINKLPYREVIPNPGVRSPKGSQDYERDK